MKNLRKTAAWAGALLAVTVPGIAAAQTLDTGNTAWMLTSTALVLFMTIPGLSLFYAGMVRAKNALSVMMQCFAITCLVTVLWALYAYSLAFGPDVGLFIGSLDKVFMKGVGVDTVSGSIPETVFSMFQLTFAIITPALIVGAFAERMKFSAMMWFMALWLTLVYAPIAHWVWGGGWLGSWGVARRQLHVCRFGPRPSAAHRDGESHYGPAEIDRSHPGKDRPGRSAGWLGGV